MPARRGDGLCHGPHFGDPRTSTATACRAGLVTVGTEMGGGGTVSVGALSICRQSVRNVLEHLGVLPACEASSHRADGRAFELLGPRAYVFAAGDGIFEQFHENGREVQAGEPAGRIHYPWDPARGPETMSYQADGILCGRRQPRRVTPGNCCLVVAAPCLGLMP